VIRAGVVFVAVLSWCAVARAGEPVKRIYTGVYLHDVTKFDQKDGVFDVDLELWAKWRGDFDADALLLANAAGDVEREEIGKESDGDWHSRRWRVRGTLRGEFPLMRFPFDSQTLAVTLELPASMGDLVPDLASSGIRSRFSVTGWRYEPLFRPRVSEETYRSDLGSLSNEGRPTTVKRVSFEVVLHRPLLMVALKLFLPLLIIILVSLLAHWLHPDQIEARSSIGVTALLSCFAFQFTVAGTLPEVAYLTVADGLFLIAYVITASALVHSIFVYALVKRGRVERALRLDRWQRVLFPLATVIPALLFMRAPAPPPPPAAAPPPRAAAPPPSARDRLRIGTGVLSSVSASAASEAIWPSVAPKGDDGAAQPLLVDAVPSVSSDTLRFLAGGELEVSWRVRPGVRWSDGRPLSAADLAFPFEVVKDPDVAEVRPVSPTELVLRYRDRVAAALDGPTPWPRAALESVYQKGGYEAVREARAKSLLPSLGPYRLVEWTPDERLVLAPNPSWTGAPPAIPHVEVRRFTSSAEAVAAFERGEVDILQPNTTTPDDTRALRARRPEAVVIRPSAAFIFLAVELGHPLLRKRAVRRAIQMAIDRERLRRAVYGDEGRVADVPVPGELPAGVISVKHDPAAARALLEQAGAVGAALTLHLSSSPIDAQIAEQVIADLGAVGLRVTKTVVPKPADMYRERKVKDLLLHVMRGSRELTPRTYFSIPMKDGHYLPEARHDGYDDEVFALAEREARALYPERRAQLRDRLYRAYAERLPTIPLVFAAERVVVDPALRGWDHGVEARFGDGLERWTFAPAAPGGAK
jgi:peptide/nickel transport system substrate-binding protein